MNPFLAKGSLQTRTILSTDMLKSRFLLEVGKPDDLDKQTKLVFQTFIDRCLSMAFSNLNFRPEDVTQKS